MNYFMEFFSWLIGYGAVLIVPLSVIVLGVIFRAPMRKTLEAALKMAVGFTALNALIGVIFNAMTPAAANMAEKFNVNFTIIDLGWPTQSGIVFAIPWALAAIAIFILLNAILVFFGIVKTLNVDFNNHWIFVFYMGATYYITGSIPFTIIVGVLFWFISLKMADWVYPYIKPYYNLPIDGLTITHAYSILWAPLGFLLDKLWDQVPGIRNIRWNAEEIQERFGFLGESIFIGWVIGFIVGLIAYVSLPITLTAIGKALALGFAVSFFMYMIPRAAELVIAGMAPLSNAIRIFVTKRMPGREFHVGLDAAVIIGAPEHTAVGVLTTPIAFALAFILPGNEVLPMGDVAGLFIFICTFITNTNRGNIFRGLLNSTLVLIPLSFIIAQDMASANMMIAQSTGFNIPEVGGLVTSLCIGTTPLGFALYKIALFFTTSHVTIDLLIGVVILVIFFAVWYLMRNRPTEYAKELELYGKNSVPKK
jgi:PTS system galactitol-specific IIC component